MEFMRNIDHLKWVIRRKLKRGGWVIRKQPILADFLKSRNVDLVIDVGANSGQFGEELRQWGYDGKILSYEPGSSAFANLTGVSMRDRGWDICKEALGDVPGTATLEVTRSTVFSSFLPQSRETHSYGAAAEVVSTEDVPVTTLDRVIFARSEKCIFVKIDTQGFERQVLAGLTDVSCVVGLQMELPVAQLYRGNWSLSEAINAVSCKGFELAQAEPVGYLKNDSVSATEFDCVFRRVRNGIE